MKTRMPEGLDTVVALDTNDFVRLSIEEVLKTLVEAGVNTYLMAAPIVGGVSDDLSMLASLVDKAAASGVSRIMWDKYNPKPMASAFPISARFPNWIPS